MSNQLELDPHRTDVIEDVYFGTADLTGQDLQFASTPFPGAVAYVKLVPLTGEETRYIVSDRARPETKRLIATFDGHDLIWRYRPRSMQDLLNAFRQFEHSDFVTWWVQAGGADIANYPTPPTWATSSEP